MRFHHARKTPNSAIYLQHTCTDGRLKYYTGQSGKITRGVQAILDRFQAAAEACAESCRLSGKPLTKATLRAALDRLRAPEVDTFAAMRRVVDEMQTGKRLTPGKKRYSALSLKTYRFTIDLLERFDPRLTPDRYHDFILWMQAQDYSTNYIGGQIKNWKMLAGAIGLPVEGLKKITEQTYDIYLNVAEIERLMAVEVSGREAVARDWFVLDCYTGLRISDLTRLSSINLTGDFISIANEKTDEPVVVPISATVRRIIDKYKGFPPRVTDQEINRTIKHVARKAKLTERVLYTITKGGKRKDEYLEKWQMVSNHTARRSFITNLRKAGVPDTLIMRLAGIKSIATLARYDKLTAAEAGRLAAGLEFFKGENLAS